MDNDQEAISQAACRLAKEMPLTTVRIVARYLSDAKSFEAAKRRLGELPQPHHRQLATNFIDECIAISPRTAPQTVTLALLTAGVSAKAHRDAQSVELVWTGPDVGAVPFRRTEQAILQVLESARSRITLVSYAVYCIPRVCEALVDAARRGVRISVIVETPDKIECENAYSTLQALGPEVAACSTVYFWPRDKRNNHGNKLGILHVKCAVADGRWLFLSSVNLTEYAFTINMELGVLLTGGDLPGQVEANFDRLTASGVLMRV